MSDEAANEILDHAKRNEVTCALVQYLDRWLNVIPRLADAGVRVVVHGHGYDLSSSLRNPATVDAYRAFLPSADCLVVPSRHVAQRLADHGHQNVTVVPYGIPVGPRPPPRSAVGPVKLLAVGRLVAKKDPVGLVEAVARARALGADLHLDLIGDGPLAPHVARAIRAHSLTNVVSTLGAVPYDAVLEAMSSADIFVQRSRTAIGGDEEGLPLSILEAMASQLPVVSTAHAGIPEAVEDGSTGLLHAEDDASGFAASIVRYCDEPDLRRAHGEAGRARVEAMFSWDRERVELRNLLGLSTATEL